MHLTKTIIWIGTSTPIFLAALFTIDKTWKQPTGPSTDEKDVIHKYNGRILSHKKEWKDAIFSNMGGPRDCLSKSKTNTVVYCSQENLIFLNDTNGLIYKTETDSHNLKQI